MGVEVAWIDEQQVAQQEVSDAYEVISRLAMSSWSKLPGSICLRFVDPCGDTTFNQAQIPFLLEELRAEVSNAIEPKFREHLEKVVRLVECATGGTHTYIKFIGD